MALFHVDLGVGSSGSYQNAGLQGLMPTPHVAFAAVAAALSGLDPDDAAAVALFWRRNFTAYPEPVREAIFDFLTTQTGVPEPGALAALRDAIARGVSRSMEAPDWDPAYGPPVAVLPRSKTDDLPAAAASA